MASGSSTARAQKNAAGTVKAIAWSSNSLLLQRVADTPGMLPALVGLLAEGRAADVQEQAAVGALWRIAYADVGLADKVANTARVLPALVALLSDAGTAGVKEQAAGALRRLAASDDGVALYVADIKTLYHQ